ncbi:MAG: hypothetical protein ABID35_06370 [Candidatus Margulisiibacteriota bacterium]
MTHDVSGAQPLGANWQAFFQGRVRSDDQRDLAEQAINGDTVTIGDVEVDLSDGATLAEIRAITGRQQDSRVDVMAAEGWHVAGDEDRQTGAEAEIVRLGEVGRMMSDVRLYASAHGLRENIALDLYQQDGLSFSRQELNNIGQNRESRQSELAQRHTRWQAREGNAERPFLQWAAAPVEQDGLGIPAESPILTNLRVFVEGDGRSIEQVADFLLLSAYSSRFHEAGQTLALRQSLGDDAEVATCSNKYNGNYENIEGLLGWLSGQDAEQIRELSDVQPDAEEPNRSEIVVSAVAAYQAGNIGEARDLFERAEGLEETAIVSAYLADCYLQLGGEENIVSATAILFELSEIPAGFPANRRGALVEAWQAIHPEAEPAAPVPVAPEPVTPPIERARAVYIQGQAHFDAGRFVQAAGSFRAAYEIVPHPICLVSEAQSYLQAEDVAAARAVIDELHETHSDRTTYGNNYEGVTADLARLEAAPPPPLDTSAMPVARELEIAPLRPTAETLRFTGFTEPVVSHVATRTPRPVPIRTTRATRPEPGAVPPVPPPQADGLATIDALIAQGPDVDMPEWMDGMFDAPEASVQVPTGPSPRDIAAGQQEDADSARVALASVTTDMAALVTEASLNAFVRRAEEASPAPAQRPQVRARVPAALFEPTGPSVRAAGPASPRPISRRRLARELQGRLRRNTGLIALNLRGRVVFVFAISPAGEVSFSRVEGSAVDMEERDCSGDITRIVQGELHGLRATAAQPGEADHTIQLPIDFAQSM